jgi:hypothetical protein
LSRAEIELSIDELVARTHAEAAVDLALWTVEAEPALGAFCAAALKHDAAWPRAGW